MFGFKNNNIKQESHLKLSGTNLYLSLPSFVPNAICLNCFLFQMPSVSIIFCPTSSLSQLLVDSNALCLNCIVIVFFSILSFDLNVFCLNCLRLHPQRHHFFLSQLSSKRLLSQKSLSELFHYSKQLSQLSFVLAVFLSPMETKYKVETGQTRSCLI